MAETTEEARARRNELQALLAQGQSLVKQIARISYDLSYTLPDLIADLEVNGQALDELVSDLEDWAREGEL